MILGLPLTLIMGRFCATVEILSNFNCVQKTRAGTFPRLMSTMLVSEMAFLREKSGFPSEL